VIKLRRIIAKVSDSEVVCGRIMAMKIKAYDETAKTPYRKL